MSTAVCLWIATLPAVCLAAWAAVAAHGSALGVDDAQIAFVYASHLAEAQGFVYNAGGERVEGFSSLLWVLLAAPLFALPGGGERWVLALSVLLTAATYVRAAGYVTVVFGRVRGVPVLVPAITYVGLLVLWPAHVTWMTASLMETSLWGLLIVSATLQVLEAGTGRGSAPPRTWAFSLVLVAMVLTRPESLLLAPVLILLHAARGAAVDGSRRTARLSLAPALAVGAAIVGLTLFRLLYFGYPLPNTYYAKVSPSLVHNLREGLSYLNSFVSSGALPIVIFFVLVGVLALNVVSLLAADGVPRLERARSLLRSDVVLLALLSCVLLGLPAVNGGDHFAWWRMYQPAYPVLLVTLFAAAAALAARLDLTPTPASVAVVAVLLLLFGTFRAYDRVTWFKAAGESPVAHEFRIARDGIEAGGRLTAMFPAEGRQPTVAVITAGGVKRTYRGPVFDLMGLNAAAMAHAAGSREGIRHHSAFDPDVFHAWSPEIVWPVPGPEAPTPRTRAFVGAVLRGLTDDPAFLARYREAAVSHAGAPGQTVTAYFRRDLLDALAADPAFTVAGTRAERLQVPRSSSPDGP